MHERFETFENCPIIIYMHFRNNGNVGVNEFNIPKALSYFVLIRTSHTNILTRILYGLYEREFVKNALCIVRTGIHVILTLVISQRSNHIH